MSYTTLTDILDFVERKKLSKLGNSFSMLCHFHKESTPSMVIDSISGNYRCYSCGKTGSISEIKYEMVGA